MKIKIIIILMAVFIANVNLLIAQPIECLTQKPLNYGLNKGANCSDFNKYNFTYIPQNTPIKYVRISFHVFNKTNGTGNFPNNQQSRDWLTNQITGNLNTTLSGLCQMNLATTSPYYTDSRIRFSIDNIYFWNDDNGWDLNATKSGYFNLGDNLFNTYVVNQSSVTNKYSSIHIFLGENDLNRGYSSANQQAENYFVGSGVYANYLNGGNWWSSTNLLIHELGHNFELWHTWYGGDECDDTPDNANCWNGVTCSNNIMDYNASKCALTQCQINRMHYFLMENKGFGISNCLITPIYPENSEILGSSILCQSPRLFSLSGLQFGVTTTWSALPSSNITISQDCGLSTSISTVNGSSNSNSILTCQLSYGKYGVADLDKKISLNKLTNTVNLCGSVNGIYSGLNVLNDNSSCTSGFNVLSGQNLSLISPFLIELNQFEVVNGGTLELNISANCP